MLFVRADDEKYGRSDLHRQFAGQGIYNADAEHLGKVDHVFVDPDDPGLVYVQAYLGGGFLNFGSKEFLVPADRLGARDGQFFLDLPKEETQLQGRIVPGDGQSMLAGILAPPVGAADHASEGIKPTVGDPTGTPDANFAANSGSWEGRRVGATSVTPIDKITSIKGNRLYEPGGDQFGTIDEVYCDLSTGDPVLVRVRYGGDPQPGGFFTLFGSGHDVLVSLDALTKEGDFYYLRERRALRMADE
jgi:sporulation protein YlmC with PRC-barrel domain